MAVHVTCKRLGQNQLEVERIVVVAVVVIVGGGGCSGGPDRPLLSTQPLRQPFASIQPGLYHNYYSTPTICTYCTVHSERDHDGTY